MILAAIIAWVLLTACVEYLLRQASFLDGLRQNVVRDWPWYGRMIGCFMCPWGWASIPAGIIVGLTVWAWTMEPWAALPVVAVLLPAFGLGLARILGTLAFGASVFKTGKGE